MIWLQYMCKDLWQLAHWYGKRKGKNTTKFMPLEEIQHIPKDWTATYKNIVCDHRPQKTTPIWSESMWSATSLITQGILLLSLRI